LTKRREHTNFKEVNYQTQGEVSMSKIHHLKQYFLSHRLVTNELIEKIEKKHYDYKPTPTSMSTKELVVHMLTSFYQFASAAAKQAPKPLYD
jgi:uncharacterized damage-inducible protein DinB